MRVAGRAVSGRRFRLASWLGRRVRRMATGTGMLVLAVPLAWPSGAGGQHLPVPTPASVRSEVIRLADWVTGNRPPPPSVPAQQAGKAPGRQHQVPAAVTRAIARAEGRAASQAPGQLPLYAFPGARVKQHVTGAFIPPAAGTQPASPPSSTPPSVTPPSSTPPSVTPPAATASTVPAASAPGPAGTTPAGGATSPDAGSSPAVTPSSAPSAQAGAAATATLDAFTGNPPPSGPQINDQWPPNGYNAPTLTPELIANGSDIDGDTLWYYFEVYDADGDTLAYSDWIPTNNWVVPAGTLAWDKTYYWTVWSGDGVAGSPDAQAFALQTPVPQPLLYEGMAQDGSGPGGSQNGGGAVFDPQNGNFTTQATDASVPVIGPAMSVERTYNSLEPRAGGAFGTGWSSLLDMQVSDRLPAADGSTATEMVTYPDGEQIEYGKNADGSYTSPQGRYGTLAVTDNFQLIDKGDTKYTFGQDLGSGNYGITSVADPQGHTLNFTYSSGVITQITSQVSQRSLYLTWSKPSGAQFPHVTAVATDPVTPGQQSSAITWQYNYTGDQLSSACNQSQPGQPCTAYTYQSGSGYPGAVLNSGPQSYWRLNETSGITAASSVLANEATDSGTYANVVLNKQPGPLAGSSSVGAAGFNQSYMKVPYSLADEAGAMSVSLWFNTTAANGVLFSQSSDPATSGTTTNPYSPVLYIGSDGKLLGGFAGTNAPLSSAAAVNNGHWHNVVLASSGTQETLYIDGNEVASQGGMTVHAFVAPYIYLGTGFLGGSYPDEPHAGSSTGTAAGFNGAMSDAATWDRQLTAAEVSSMYAIGTNPAPLLTKITRPSGKVFEQATYNLVTAQVTGVTDASGGSWTVGAPADTGSSRKYVASVLGGQPSDYWRLADVGTTTAVNQVKGGTATYSNVTQGVTGGPFTDAMVDGFNGSSSYLALPNGLIGAGNQSVSLWFKTTATDGVLLSSSAAPVTGSTTTSAFTPNLYVGQDGHLNGEFYYGSTPIASSNQVNDGKWHNVVLAAKADGQALYLDGQQVGTVSGTITGGSGAGQSYDYIGTGFLGYPWADQPHNSSSGTTGYPSAFNGNIAEVAFYPGQMSIDEAAGQWDAAQHSAGLAPIETTQVTDPGGRTLSYVYDPLNSGRMLSQTDGLGDTTTYGYDSAGFQDQVTDPNGDVTDSGHDVRGNVVSTVTCQNQAALKCSTSYASYSPNETTAELQPPYSGNDLMQSFRDGRSASSTDNTYLTSSIYDSSTGELLSQTTPPVPGYPSGRTTNYSYTDGTTTAGSADGSVPPAGLLWQTVSPAGAVTQTLYDWNGDVTETISPLGLETFYSYDGIGRKVQEKVVSDTYTLITTYAYDADGRVTLQTDPAVTDRVTGAVHTGQVTSTYDADGNLLSQKTADTTGGDTLRTVSATYNAFDQKATSTDAAGAVTQYTYDPYGNLASQTDPAGNVTSYAYDPNGRLLTTTLPNYTGSPPGSQAAAPLIEESRAYDPAGRLASVTDAMGRVTSYAYTDDGLTASVTRTGPGGGSYAQETDTYDPAGNLITRVTNNGATTTNYSVDAASRVASQALDPSGLNRVTAYTYTPDDHVATQAVSQGSGSALQTTTYTYDLMGNKTSEMVSDPGAEGPAGWWPLNETSGTAAYDWSASSNVATASGVTWTGDGARFTGQAGQVITTRGPMVDTTGSFTVSAWVNLAGFTGSAEIALGQDAGAVSGFYLGIGSGGSDWEFGRAEEDVNNAPDWAVADNGATARSGWTLLTGVYNVNTGAVQLYVNGSDNGGDDTDPSPIASTGPLEIGGDKWNGQPDIHNFNGTISDVQVYPFALSASEVGFLYGQKRWGGDLTRDNLTTSYQLDQLGQVTAQTSPDGITTSYAYDAAGHQTLVTGPPVAAQVSGGTPVAARPITTTGYNTFGEVAEAQDPNGNTTTYVYDADGRVVSQALPPYTPPGASSPVSGTTVTAYNTLGQVTTSTDPLGNVTHYAYDQLGHRTSQTDPGGGVTSSSYDPVGEALSVTGPTGAQATSTYDYLGRQVTATSVERYPAPASYTTTTSYAPTAADPSGTWKSLVTTPAGVTTSYGYDAAGEATQVTDGAGNLTRFSFDALGRETATVNPDGTSDTVTYDAAGNRLGQASLDAAGQTLASTSATYNGEGQQLSTIDALGYCTAYTYDPTGSLTAETQPVSSSLGIITSFGYDAAGNQTRYTDGNGRPWITTYNSWNLPQTQVEPATSTYTTPANSTTTIAYNGDQQPVTLTEPGGVTVTDTYDAMGNVTGQSGSGASAPTASRSFSYDSAGRMLTAATTSTAGSGHPSNATSETFTWNDRGLLLTTAGSAGSTSYTWNGDGQQATVQDAAGTSSFTYDSAGRLHTMADPASGATLTYTYNPMSQPSQVAYGGTGTDVRSLGYDSLHRLTSDTLTHGSTTLASVTYGYNAGGYLTSKTTTGVAGASANTYGYDRAGRLTSWTSGTTTTSYAYDGAGNRVQAGTTSYTYDARDQLTSDGTSSYAYTADGDLASVTGPSGTVTSTSDAYGQQSAQGTQNGTYDALGRDTQLTTPGGATALAYEGTTALLAGDGTSSYTYTPGGALTGTAPANSPGTGVLDLTDHHTDLTAQFTPAGTTLTGSRTYGPWGATTATGGTLMGSLGYQSQYTSPATGQVNMGARWYNPATGSFGNKDTVTNKPVPDSASASPFGYAADNPLGFTDPTGHTALDAHQLHLLHLAHVAAVAHAAHVAHVAHVAAVVAAGVAAWRVVPVSTRPVDTGGKSFKPLTEGQYEGSKIFVDKNGIPHPVANTADDDTIEMREFLNDQLESQGHLLSNGTGSIYYYQDDKVFPAAKGIMTGADGRTVAAGTTSDLIKVTFNRGVLTSVQDYDVTGTKANATIENISKTINNKLPGGSKSQTNNVVFSAKNDDQAQIVNDRFAGHPSVRVVNTSSGFDSGEVEGSSVAGDAAGIDGGAADLLGPLGLALLLFDVQRRGGLGSPGACALVMMPSLCPGSAPASTPGRVPANSI